MRFSAVHCVPSDGLTLVPIADARGNVGLLGVPSAEFGQEPYPNLLIVLGAGMLGSTRLSDHVDVVQCASED